MIELPESRTLATQISESLKGKIIMNVSANKSPHKFAWFSGDPGRYHALLSEKMITGTNSYGGMVEIVVENMRLVFCDGTNIRYFQTGEKLPEKHQLHIEFEDFSSLICSVQMYGALWLFDKTEDKGYYHSSKTKLSPLSSEFTKDYYLEHMQKVKQSLSIKAFLATEQRFSGLGNGVLQDILLNARVHPRRKLETLSDLEKQNTYTSVKQTLFEMTVQGGRNTEKDLFRFPGGYQTKLSAKTKKDPCPLCGDAIIRETYLGGNIYFCPTCQKFEKKSK